MSYAYQTLNKRTKDNSPGITKRVLLSPRADFDVIAKPSAAGLIPGDTVRITGTHTFLEGKGFVECYTTMDTGEFTAETVGERDSRNVNPKLVFFHPGLYAEAIEFALEAKNDEFIILVETLGDEYLQIGREGLEAEISNSMGSGKVSGGQKGITFTAESFGAPQIYEGDITLKPVA